MEKEDRGTKKAFDKEMAEWKQDLATAREQVITFLLFEVFNLYFSWFLFMMVKFDICLKFNHYYRNVII